ncbi:DNA repair protein XRCC3 [Dermacentor albipictus]|uniref:DNA repair protein XRCC3 n=1 Tax=Dermacentor albipictus TaxID=60249 RepID=UPI0031FCD91A
MAAYARTPVKTTSKSADAMAGPPEDVDAVDLKMTLLEFRLSAGLSKGEASRKLASACRRAAAIGLAANTLSEPPRLSLGCPVLDEYLDGGPSTRGLIELCGESGSGKTQLCLQASLAATAVGDDAHVLYVCTEERFPEKRLRQMDPSAVRGERVLVAQLGEWPMLIQCLEGSLPGLRRTRRVTLLVIDSVAALLRADPERAQGLRRLGALLDGLWRSGVAVLCVNQVTDVPGGRTAPSLGPGWANLVTTRLVTSRSPSGVRALRVAFAPSMSPREPCRFAITADGVRGVR